MIDLELLIPVVTAQIFPRTAKLSIPTEIPTNETNTGIEIKALTAN